MVVVVLAMGVVVVSMRPLGGFDFIGPMLMVIPITLFAAGFLGGGARGSSWAKAARINTGNWCWIIWLASDDVAWQTIAGWVLATFAPTVCGVWLRHRWTKARAGA